MLEAGMPTNTGSDPDHPISVMLCGNPQLKKEFLEGLGEINDVVFWKESQLTIDEQSFRFWMPAPAIPVGLEKDRPAYILLLAVDDAEMVAHMKALPKKLPENYHILRKMTTGFDASGSGSAKTLASKIAKLHLKRTGHDTGVATAEDKAAAYGTARTSCRSVRRRQAAARKGKAGDAPVEMGSMC